MSKPTQQWFDVGETPTITIETAGNLTIRAQPLASIIAVSRDNTELHVDGTNIRSDNDLKLVVPLASEIHVKYCAGDLKIKGVQGDVTIDDVGGQVGVAALDGTVTIQTVQGDLKARDVSGQVTITEDIAGDAKLHTVGGFVAKNIFGDLIATHLSGDVSINEIYGDAVVRSCVGTVTLNDVYGDCAVGQLGGITTISARDDIRINGPLAMGKHSFSSDSTIAFRWPPTSPLTLTASSKTIKNKLPLTTVTEKAGKLGGKLGDGSIHVELTAAERITLSPTPASEGTQWENFADIEFDFAGLGEQISAELNARMGELSERMGPEINLKVEQAIRKAQTAVERLAQQMEINIERTNRPPKPPSRPTKTTAPKAKSNQPPKDTTEAQLKILKMLENGTISVDDANQLLASLE